MSAVSVPEQESRTAFTRLREPDSQGQGAGATFARRESNPSGPVATTRPSTLLAAGALKSEHLSGQSAPDFGSPLTLSPSLRRSTGVLHGQKWSYKRRGGQSKGWRSNGYPEPGHLAGRLAAQRVPEDEIRKNLQRHYGPWISERELARIAAYVVRREQEKAAPLRAELRRLDAEFEAARWWGRAFPRRDQPSLLRKMGESGWSVWLTLAALERWVVNRTHSVVAPESSYGPILKVSGSSLHRLLSEMVVAGVLPRTWSRRTIGRALHRLAKLGLLLYRPGLTLDDAMEMLRTSEVRGDCVVLRSEKHHVVCEVPLKTLDGGALLQAKRDPDLRVSACLSVMARLRVPGRVLRKRIRLSEWTGQRDELDRPKSDRRHSYETRNREARRIRDKERALRRREYWRTYKAERRRRSKAAQGTRSDSCNSEEAVTNAR